MTAVQMEQKVLCLSVLRGVHNPNLSHPVRGTEPGCVCNVCGNLRILNDP